MSSFKAFCGKVVPHQETFSARHCSLYGESPMYGAILANSDFDGTVVFDGQDWRELDLAAMQRAVIQGQGSAPDYGHEGNYEKNGKQGLLD